MTYYAKILITLTTATLLFSCSNKFGSKEEASNAKREFLDGGREFVVVDVPTNLEVADEIGREKTLREWGCKTAKEHLRTGEVAGQPIDPYYLRQKRKSVERDCVANAPIMASKESLTKRETKNTRTCNYEEETRSYVCKEWKVRGYEIMKEKWLDLKPTYTYFRF